MTHKNVDTHHLSVGAGPTYSERLHHRRRRVKVDLTGGDSHADVRQKHGTRDARARLSDAVRGCHNIRSAYDRPTAQKCSWLRGDREPHLIRKLLNAHKNTNGLLTWWRTKQLNLILTPDVAAVPPTIFGSTRFERRCQRRVRSKFYLSIELIHACWRCKKWIDPFLPAEMQITKRKAVKTKILWLILY